MTDPRNSARKTRGRPFAPGNAGRPKGSRNRATLAAEALLEGEAERLARAAVTLALNGDTTALRLCLERLIPVKKERRLELPLASPSGPADHHRVLANLIEAVTKGEVTPGEASGVASLIDLHRRAIETAEIEARLTKLEEENGGRKL